MDEIPDPCLPTSYSCHSRTCFYGRPNHRMRWPSLECTSGHGKLPTGRSFPTIISINFASEDRAHSYDFASLDPLRPRTIVAVEDGLIHGFATTAPSRDPDLGDYGELCALYVDPQKWGRGMGAALVSAARAQLVEFGFRRAFLWVLAGNVRADRFYQSDGWAPDGVKRTDSVWAVTVNEVRYQRGLGTP